MDVECPVHRSTCHRIFNMVDVWRKPGVCVPRRCRVPEDCPNVGHVDSGFVSGWCNSQWGRCIYGSMAF